MMQCLLHWSYQICKNEKSSFQNKYRRSGCRETMDASVRRDWKVINRISGNVYKIKEKDTTLRKWIFAGTNFHGKNFYFSFQLHKLIFVKKPFSNILRQLRFFPARLRKAACKANQRLHFHLYSMMKKFYGN